MKCSKLAIETPEQRQRRSGFFIVNFEHISHLALLFLFLNLSRYMPVGIVSSIVSQNVVEYNCTIFICVEQLLKNPKINFLVD